MAATSSSFTTTVELGVIVDGQRYECSHVDAESVTLSQGIGPAACGPCEAEIVVTVDGEARRNRVFLPDGVNGDRRIAVERS